MAPIQVCLLSLGGSILWFLYTFICKFRAFFRALGKSWAVGIIGFLGYHAVRLIWSGILIRFTNAPLFGPFVKQCFDAIGGWDTVVGAVLVLVFLGGIFLFLGGVAFFAGGALAKGIVFAMDFFEKKAAMAYQAAFTKMGECVLNAGGDD